VDFIINYSNHVKEQKAFIVINSDFEVMIIIMVKSELEVMAELEVIVIIMVINSDFQVIIIIGFNSE